MSYNSQLSGDQIAQFCFESGSQMKQVKSFFNSEKISFRGGQAILKIARTIADLDGKPWVGFEDILEAFEMRAIDRTLMGLEEDF
jgi:magnesium chelatase family protein